MHSETEDLTEKLDLKNKLLLIMGYIPNTQLQRKTTFTKTFINLRID